MKTKLELLITLTWSKIMAFALLACSIVLDLKNGTASTFMFTVPFISALIIGKQYLDKDRKDGTESNESI
jgi:hypothetical protein